MALIEQGAAQVIKAEIAWHRDMEARARECMETAGETDKEQYIVSCRIAEENREKAQALEWALKKALSAAAPVVHGELESTGMDELYAEFGRCTVCGGDNYIKAKFCNWCGAKLDGGEEHEAG